MWRVSVPGRRVQSVPDTIVGVCASSVIGLKNRGSVTGKVTNDRLFRAFCESSRQIYFEPLFR